MSTDTLAAFKKVFENDFWTDASDDDEGIGSDDSMESSNNNNEEYYDETPANDSDISHQPARKATNSLIKRSKSLLVINHFGSRIIQHIRR